MKKVNFFKVMSACMAFAAVTFTSCTEEEMTIDSPDVTLPESPVVAPTASVSISVYDVNTSILLGISSVDATANIGGKMTIDCPEYEGYIVAPSIEVEIPSLSEGQSVVVPVAFYTADEESAEAAIIAQLTNGTEIEALELSKTVKEYKNDGNGHTPKVMIVKPEDNKYTILTGKEYVGEGEAVESKAATGYEFIESVLKDITYGKFTWGFPKFFVNPYHQTTTTVEQVGALVQYTIKFNGGVYYVQFNEAGKATWKMAAHTVIPEYAHEWAHMHAHGKAGHDWHSHDSNGNAGGGIIEAE